jgi:RNA polymerase sigma factor (TIGR02999 family)
LQQPVSSADITGLLQAWIDGDREAENALLNAVYPVLRDIARARLRRLPGGLTLSATEIAHEAYAKLAQANDIGFKSRAHFYAVAARAVRHIVIDYARARSSDKRGGKIPVVSLDAVDHEDHAASIDLDVDWLSVHDALEELTKLDESCARVVELKFFSGLSNEEIAETTRVSRATVVREWRFARAWLADRLGAA